MKILVVSDIHSDYDPLESACLNETPDLILDCGDHDNISNWGGSIPHYFIGGNHEPDEIAINSGAQELPHRIIPGTKYLFSKMNNVMTFAGISGNYSSKPSDLKVGESDLLALRKIPVGGLDVLLLHESPYNRIDSSLDQNNSDFSGYSRSDKEFLPRKVIDEINRIRPKFVFSGHSGRKSDFKKNGVVHVILPGMAKGYGILEVEDGTFLYQDRTALWK